MRTLWLLALVVGCYRQPAAPAPGASEAPVQAPAATPARASRAVRSPPPAQDDEDLALADQAFEAADLATAQHHYERAARSGSPKAADYARYKLGWVSLNLGDPKQALAHFLDVTRSTNPVLRREATRDLMLAYAHVGRADRALPFVRRVDRARAYELLRSLGDRYASLGKYADARVVLRAAAEGDPDPARACDARVALLDATIAVGRHADLLADAADLTRVASTGGDACREAAHALVAELARAWQRELPKSRGRPADVIEMWKHAGALATRAADQAEAARARQALPAD